MNGATTRATHAHGYGSAPSTTPDGELLHQPTLEVVQPQVFFALRFSLTQRSAAKATSVSANSKVEDAYAAEQKKETRTFSMN